MKKTYNDIDKDTIHPALKAIACTLRWFDYYDMRIVYERYKLRVTPIEHDSQEWLSEGWAIGEKLQAKAYYSYKVGIHPSRWAEVMRQVSPEEFIQLMKLKTYHSYSSTDNAKHLAIPFMNYLHGKPFIEELRGLNHKDLDYNDYIESQVLLDLATSEEYLDFVQKADYSVLKWVYDRKFRKDWRQLIPIGSEEILKALFFENQFLDKAQREQLYECYLYENEFLTTGRLNEVLAKMTPGSEYHQRLTAIKLLHEGKADLALDVFLQLFKRLECEYSTEPLTDFAYGLALGLVQSPQAQSIAKKLMSNKKTAKAPDCYPMLLALHHYYKNDAADFLKQSPLSNCTDSPMAQCLSVMFLRHYNILLSEPAEFKTQEKFVTNSCYDYLKLLYSYDFPSLRIIFVQLNNKTGLNNSLMPPVKKTEKWEMVIDNLLRLHDKISAADVLNEVEMERVAYFITLPGCYIQPKLQKSKDGGITWSKGRNMSLKTFGKTDDEFFTPTDRKIAAMVKTSRGGWYGGITYTLSGKDAIAALAGCPSVYDEETELPIDVVQESPMITVLPTGKGYEVKSNIDLSKLNFNGDIQITQEGSRQLTVVKVSQKQYKTLELLSKLKIFPKQSKEQLAKLLQLLSTHFTVMSPLLRNSDNLKHIETNSLIAVQISPGRDMMYNISVAVKPFGTHPPYQKPGKGMEIISTTINGERVQTERNLEAELRNLDALKEIMKDYSEDFDCNWTLDTYECLQLLDTLFENQENAYVEWPQGVRIRVSHHMIDTEKLSLSIRSMGEWFEIEGDVAISDKERIKIGTMLGKLNDMKGNFIRIGEDEYVRISHDLLRQLQALESMNTGRGDRVKVAAINGLLLSTFQQTGTQVTADNTFEQLAERIREAEKKHFSVPMNIHAQLRPYQEDGFQWMSRLAWWGAGACLADDMGLGKTLQSITLMQSRALHGPQLVIMPTSVLLNWREELMKFAPALSVKVLNQAGADRKQIVKEAEAGDVVLCTYGLLVTEEELLASRKWTTIVLDEAHTIKNRDTQTSKGAMKLKGDFRLMLTGTPLQNHLSEIWNLFQFANPGLLGSFQQFTERFILPVERNHDKERQYLLRRLLSPFLLRRTKEDVLNELPEKTEITLTIELSDEEKALYENLRKQAIVTLSEGKKDSAIQALAEITRLRQAACHPRLINSQLEIASSKTSALLNLVAELMRNRHKALVFSQFTSHLALIKEALDKQRVNYLYLDGTMTSQERNRLVREFQTGDTPLFLISLKAGGLGLNLTAADYVIHLDPWWNPAIEDQASDRAHRIGQERPVTVYRLIAQGTIEEKILRLHQDKRSLADALLQDADIHSQLSAEELINLLKEDL